MAEVAGLVIGGISMATLVDGCMRTFERIESARTYGRDYQKAALRLSLLQLRFSRWVAGVIETVKQQNLEIGTSEDALTVQYLLGDIIDTIETTERYAQRHNTVMPRQTNPEDEKQIATMDRLAHKVKAMAIHRQKNASIKQRARWALRDERKFKKLLSDLATSISELEQLFPPAYMRMIAETRKGLAKTEALELIQPSEIEEPIEAEDVARILEDVAADVDKVLVEAVENAAQHTRRARHSYGEINSSDDAKIFVGDYVGPGQKKSGDGHTYVKLTASGNSRVHYGDSFGGKSVFDD